MPAHCHPPDPDAGELGNESKERAEREASRRAHCLTLARGVSGWRLWQATMATWSWRDTFGYRGEVVARTIIERRKEASNSE